MLYWWLLSQLLLGCRADTSRPLYEAGKPGSREGMLDIHVGLMLPFNSTRLLNQFGFATSAGSQVLALDRIREEQLLNNVNWTFTYYFPECNEYLAAGIATQLILVDEVDVIIGPPCSLAAMVVSPIAKYYNIPVISWGATQTELSDRRRFANFARTVPSADAVGKGILIALKRYKWKRVALLYNNDGQQQECVNFANGLKQQIRKAKNITLAFEQELSDEELTRDNFDVFFDDIQLKARILVVCIDNEFGKREFLIRAAEVLGGEDGLDNYQFLLADFLPKTKRGRDVRFWFSGDYPVSVPADPKDDEKAFQALKHSAVVHLRRKLENRVLDDIFRANVVRAVERWPFEYTLSDEERNYYPSTFSPYMHDALYLYARALNRTLEDGEPARKNGIYIIATTRKVTPFLGVSGIVELDEYSTRQPTLVLRRALSNNSTAPLEVTGLIITYQDDVEKFQQFNSTHPQAVIWQAYANKKPPPSEPPCGFEGEKCFDTDTTLIALLSIAGLILLVSVSCGIALALLKSVQKQRQRLRNMWWIVASELKTTGDATNDTVSHFTNSSNNSSSKSKASHFSKSFGSQASDRPNFPPGHRERAVYQKQTVLVMRFDKAHSLTADDEHELQQMRHLSHNNVNPFVGLCVGDNGMRLVFSDCPKGSLLTVLTTAKIDVDWMFKYSLIHDLVEGLNYLSESPLGCHGYLTSYSCLIDSRWILRINDYGLKRLRAKEVTKPELLMWTPPELLRNKNQPRDVKTDVYSLGIIMSEIISRQKAYSENNASVEGYIDQQASEILFRVGHNESRKYRPQIRPEHISLVPQAIVALMNSCWEPHADARPGMISVQTQLSMMLEDGSSPALVDHVLRMVEKKAAELKEKTKELTDEKKKTEALLYRLLPAQVADKMKVGERVDPEHYDSATIFFSDVVSFTTLASKCSPLQVVDLLNSLYTRFDALIEMFDIYKVETIGDGYLCVSGIPHRNGEQHAGHIADLSLKLLESVAIMQIPHLPQERIQLRIGIHSDAVVAAVVGLAMPRYCLFGDAVNTASRMESHSLPNKIQITENTVRLLKKLGGYKTELRGETIIKGKGPMITHWLKGKSGQIPHELNHAQDEKSYVVKKISRDEQ